MFNTSISNPHAPQLMDVPSTQEILTDLQRDLARFTAVAAAAQGHEEAVAVDGADAAAGSSGSTKSRQYMPWPLKYQPMAADQVDVTSVTSHIE